MWKTHANSEHNYLTARFSFPDFGRHKIVCGVVVCWLKKLAVVGLFVDDYNRFY